MDTPLLRRLCETPGIPGREERVRAVIEEVVADLFDEIRTDALGSLICTRRPTIAPKRGQKPVRVLIAAHMDEIGFYVRHIDEKGFLWINPAGGFDTRNLFARRVTVLTANGDYPGVMNPGGKPVHIASAEDRKKVPEIEEFFIDLGMDLTTIQRDVRIGDPVVLDEPFLELPNRIVSKALDNRLACFIAIEALRAIAGVSGAAGASGGKKSKSRKPGIGPDHAAEIVVAFTVQEEVGLRGAITAANQVEADIGIGLDTTLAVDTPGVPDTMRVTKQGDGVGIMLQDGSMIADAALSRELVDLAESHAIPVQRCILPRGGQDGAAIQRAGAGARCAAVVVGTRYIHTVTEMVDRTDVEAAIALLAAWLPRVA
ncbi:MAG: M20/M25/M40 family metallo-hydrolase [Phycisphaeraceae bacterium]|nr:M20/M25/M40 family metallo-hydrolase [Phycisphaeraceae bacterium]